MFDLLPPSLAIALATVDTPRSQEYGSDRHLIGVALFGVEEHAPGEFRYLYGAHVVPAGASDAILIDWLTERLPKDRIVIGWQLAEHIIPSLLQASQTCAPEEARAFVDALAALVSVDAVDLAGPELPGSTFGEFCAALNVPFASVPEEKMTADWALGRDAELVEGLTKNVVAAWRCWAQAVCQEDSTVGGAAAAQLSIWLEANGLVHCKPTTETGDA